MNNDYSEKELKLIEYFGFSNTLTDKSIQPPMIYKLMVEKAFTDNMQGDEVESLRRCYRALRNCTVYRMTVQWDDMIQFSRDYLNNEMDYPIVDGTSVVILKDQKIHILPEDLSMKGAMTTVVRFKAGTIGVVEKIDKTYGGENTETIYYVALSQDGKNYYNVGVRPVFCRRATGEEIANYSINGTVVKV